MIYNIMENYKINKNKDMEYNKNLMNIIMKDSLKMINFMGQEELFTKINLIIRDIF